MESSDFHNSMVGRMDIVCCFDHNFVMPTGVMTYSLCVNNKSSGVVFHFITDESVTQQDKIDLFNITSKFVEKRIEFYPIDSTFFKTLPQLDGRLLTQATYYRLFLSEILPSTLNKVLYLDGDMIVCQSLLKLWNIDISNVALAGVPDLLSNKETCKRLACPSQLTYFNAGVLLINLDYWRKNHVISQFMDYINFNGDNLYYHDQDVLNYVFRERKLLLPLEYNIISVFLFRYNQQQIKEMGLDVKSALKHPFIVHFTDVTKPWQRTENTPSDPHPFAKDYVFYQSKTLWKGAFNDLRPFKIRIRRFLGDFLRKIGLKAEIKNTYISLQDDV